MPKEVVNFPSYAKNHPFAAAFKLHWSNEGDPAGWVQLSVQFNGKEVREWLAQHDDAKDPRPEFYSEPLDRREVQKLIRAGRRARNAVFGADE